MNKERKVFWTAIVLMLVAICFVLWNQFAGQPAEVISVVQPTAQKSLSQTDTAQNLPQNPPVISQSQTSTPIISAKAVPAVDEMTDENEKYLKEFDPKLFQISGMEDFIRDRLWLALDQLNNPLMQKLNLSSDEIAAFKSLAVSNLVMAAERGGAFREQGPAAVEAAIDGALTAQQGNFEAQLRRLLGDARFAQYERGMEDYSQFYGIKFLGDNAPLPDPQVERILAVMQSERQTVDAAALKVQYEEGAPLSADDYLQIQELIVGRTCGRLGNVLSPEQLTSFGQFELQQLDLFRTRLGAGGAQSTSQF